MVKSERLTLRNITEQDIDFLEIVLLNENLMKYIPFAFSNRDHVVTLTHSLLEAQLLENRKQYFLVIEEKHSKQAIGTITAKIISDEIQDGVAILGYTILKEYWGHGYATEATKAIISFFLNTLQLHRIEASSVPENKSSEKVLKKVGMICEGTKRKSLKIDRNWYDEVGYAILRDDYPTCIGK